MPLFQEENRLIFPKMPPHPLFFVCLFAFCFATVDMSTTQNTMNRKARVTILNIYALNTVYR